MRKSTKVTRKKKGKKRNRARKAESRNDTEGSYKKSSKELPPCLNPDCDEHHYVKYCNMTPDEDKVRYIAEVRARRRKGKSDKYAGMTKGKINRIAAEQIDSHTSLFSAFFR